LAGLRLKHVDHLLASPDLALEDLGRPPGPHLNAPRSGRCRLSADRGVNGQPRQREGKDKECNPSMTDQLLPH
jgi:hypothetical protein